MVNTEFMYIKTMAQKHAFCKIYVINLHNRADKKEHMINELTRENIYMNTRFINAIEGRSIDKLSLVDNNIFSTNMSKPGEIGCWLSHILCWHEIATHDDPYAIIFEDDIIVPYHFKELFRDIMKTVYNTKWDFIFLGRNALKNRTPVSHPVKKNSNVCYITDPGFGLFAYVITKETAKRLISTVFPIAKKAVDVWIRTIAPDYTMIALESDIISIKSYADSDTRPATFFVS